MKNDYKISLVNRIIIRIQKQLFEPMTDANKNKFQKITKTITETSSSNNKGMEKLNEKVLEVIQDRGMIASFVASSLINLFKPENKSQF